MLFESFYDRKSLVEPEHFTSRARTGTEKRFYRRKLIPRLWAFKGSEMCVYGFGFGSVAFIERSIGNTKEYTVSVEQHLRFKVLKRTDKWKYTGTEKVIAKCPI